MRKKLSQEVKSCKIKCHDKSKKVVLERKKCESCKIIVATTNGISFQWFFSFKIYDELGFELLKWFRRLSIFYKIKSSNIPDYLFQLIPNLTNHSSRVLMSVEHSGVEPKHLKNSFFPYLTN